MPNVNGKFIAKISGLTKNYGTLTALSDVTFSVERGELFGYLGPNGAGKTTTINILCGLLQRDAGTVNLCGLDIDQSPVSIKQRIGVVPEESNLYPELTCRRNLEYLAELYGLPRAVRRTRTEELLAAFDLSDRATTPFRALSRGMKRRLTVAAALVHSPEVLFLDEPTSGLDVPSARDLRSMIQDANRRGTTIFLTTHNLAEAESLCHRILILVKGRVVSQGTADEIRRRAEKAKSLSVAFSRAAPEKSLTDECPAILSASLAEGYYRLEVADLHAALDQLLAFSRRQGIRILEITTVTPTLEDAFVAILNERSQAGDAHP